MENYSIYFGIKDTDVYDSMVIEALNLQEAEDIARLYAIDLYEIRESSTRNYYDRATFEYLQEREEKLDYSAQPFNRGIK